MRKLLVAAALVAAAAPGIAPAYHAGCVANPGIPSCTYTAIGSHQCAGATEASWEVTVVREEATVVLASGGSGPVVGEGVDALPGEVATLTIKADGPGGAPVGLITCGNTAGHP